MKLNRLTKAFYIIGAASLLFTSGCATAFVRPKSTVEPRHVFPATAFDGQLFWRSGVRGEPLFATADPKERLNPVARFACGVGCIFDLPFSVVFDTILLPFDLTRGRTEDATTCPLSQFASPDNFLFGANRIFISKN
jgi:uncharacterized protein YceK